MNATVIPPPLPFSISPAEEWRRVQRRNLLGLVCAILAMVVYLILMANWLAPVGFRFSPGNLNRAVLIAGLLIPLGVIILIISMCQGFVRGAGSVFVALPALPSTFLAGWLMIIGDPVSFERLHDVTAGRYQIIVYQTNGGATTTFGICVRQELPFRFGLSLVREIYRSQVPDDATVEVTGPASIRILPRKDVNLKPVTIELQTFELF